MNSSFEVFVFGSFLEKGCYHLSMCFFGKVSVFYKKIFLQKNAKNEK